MVVYEVTLEFQYELADVYLAWIPDHFTEMLRFDGFQKAHFWEEVALEHASTPPTTRKFISQFEILNHQYLQNYLQHNFSHMRQATIDKFGGKFTATRRVLNHLRSQAS